MSDTTATLIQNVHALANATGSTDKVLRESILSTNALAVAAGNAAAEAHQLAQEAKTVVISDPSFELPTPAAGFSISFSVSAQSLLNPAQAIRHFLLYSQELGIDGQQVAASDGVGTVNISVPASLTEGSSLHVALVAVDALGNKSNAVMETATVLHGHVLPPALSSPISNAEVIYNGAGVIVTTGSFQTENVSDTHAATTFTVSRDAAGADIVATYTSSSAETSHTFSGLNLTAGQTYYARARHTGVQLGDSEWSDAVPFVARAATVDAPTVTAPVANTTVVSNVDGLTVTTSAFAASGAQDTHASTDYRITSDLSGNAVVAQALASSDLTSHTFTPQDLAALNNGTAYVWARHSGTTLGQSAWSEPVAVTVAKASIATPSVLTPAANADVVISGGLTVSLSAFTVNGAGTNTDTHTSSSYWITSDAAGENVVASSLNNTTDLTSHTFSASDVSSLVAGNTYYAWGQQTGAVLGASQKSAPVAFTAAEQMILFTTSTAGSGINFFSKASTEATPITDYTVSINGVETQQAYNSLTFSQGDVVKITAKNGVEIYPQFYADSKNYLASIDAPFPYMVDSSGQAVTDFGSCFRGCSNLTSIPTGLFDNNTAVTNFDRCFRDCSSLTSIPTGLFDKNTAVTRFSSCFQACTNLTSIPIGLFDKNTAVTSFMTCFYNCSNLTSIPTGLFDKNTAAVDMGGCFRNCSNLTSIPTGLFDNNTAVTSFSNCFNGCSAIISALPTLWTRTNVTSYTNCFTGCTKASNYSTAQAQGWA